MNGGDPSTPGPTTNICQLMTPVCGLGILFFFRKVSAAPQLTEDDVLGSFLTAEWQLPYEQGLICQHPIWRTAEPLGDGPHGPGMTKLRGCSQPSPGAWPFRVIDRRSKRHFLRGDLWQRWHGRTSLRAYGVQTEPCICLLRSRQCHFNLLP